MRLSPKRALSLALVAAFLVTLVPVAEADHAYSHRYLVLGRLVGEDGLPIKGAVVEVTFDNQVRVDGRCDPSQRANSFTEAWGQTLTQPTTNEAGEFMYCFHIHSIHPALNAPVRAKYNGTEVSEKIDTKFRKTHLDIVVAGQNGSPSPVFSDTYLVSGRLWEANPNTIVEHIPVLGNVYENEPVTVKFVTATGEEIVREQTTNEYGDFAVRLNVTEAMGPGKVFVTARNETKEYDTDMTTRWTDAKIVIGKTAAEKAVGSALKFFGVVAIIAAVSVGGWYGYKTMAARRDVARARSTSTRKRAQR